MIRGHVALARHLQNYLESSSIPISAWAPEYEIDPDDGKPIYIDSRLDGVLSWAGEKFDVILVAPSDDDGDDPEKRNEPLGRLAVRRQRDGLTVRGVLDISTWRLAAYLIGGCR